MDLREICGVTPPCRWRFRTAQAAGTIQTAGETPALQKPGRRSGQVPCPHRGSESRTRIGLQPEGALAFSRRPYDSAREADFGWGERKGLEGVIRSNATRAL